MQWIQSLWSTFEKFHSKEIDTFIVKSAGHSRQRADSPRNHLALSARAQLMRMMNPSINATYTLEQHSHGRKPPVRSWYSWTPGIRHRAIRHACKWNMANLYNDAQWLTNSVASRPRTADRRSNGMRDGSKSTWTGGGNGRDFATILEIP